MSYARAALAEFLGLADIEVDGSRPWDIHIHDDRVFSRVVTQGSLGLGESYVDGWWDCEDLSEFFNRVLLAKLDKRSIGVKGMWRHALKASLLNLQSRSGARIVSKVHYDKGNDLFEHMLDKRMTLSLPKTRSERPTVVRAPHHIDSTRWHQLAVSPTQVTPRQGTLPMYAHE